eukprot:365120-Chlamydomonas_euryale.AAC.3
MSAVGAALPEGVHRQRTRPCRSELQPIGGMDSWRFWRSGRLGQSRETSPEELSNRPMSRCEPLPSASRTTRASQPATATNVRLQPAGASTFRCASLVDLGFGGGKGF